MKLMFCFIVSVLMECLSALSAINIIRQIFLKTHVLFSTIDLELICFPA